jgi:GTPase SAR1 family protein
VEPLDAAFERFRTLHAEVAAYINSIETEADTRLKVINRVLVEVLGWPYAELMTEEHADGGYADYICKVSGRSRLIVEAKRDGRSLGCEGRPSGAPFKLSGPVFRSEAAQEGLTQAIRYCGSKSAELAIVTNGREWIVFRGNRLGDGLDTSDGMAFVFPNLVAVEEKFSLFYSLASYDSGRTFAYRPYFQEAEGQPIRTSVFHKSYRPQGSAHFLPGGELAADVDKIMASFFQRLTGDQDPNLIELCFVETSESLHAEHQLAKIAETVIDRIRSLDTGSGLALTELIARVRGANQHEFVLIVGTKGAGKSTFISRFFKKVLPRATAQHCAVVRIDLGTSDGDRDKLSGWLDASLLQAMEKSLFEDGPGFSELQGMFYDEYSRLRKGPWKELYESDRTAFRIKFGEKIETLRTTNPSDYIQGLIRFVVNSRLDLPVIVFDNADHFDIDYQQRVYQYARAIYEKAVCLIILPITDRTSWQLTKHGALQSFEHEALFLPTPPTDDIIRKRIDYIERQIEMERERPEDQYFTSRGITLSINDLAGFTRSLQRVFLQTSDVSRWIGDLANHDVRRTLNLARFLIASPHLKVDDLVRAHLSGTALDVPQWRITRALIRGHHDIYPVGQHDFVQNVFALNEDLATTPLLGVRLLQLLSDVPKTEHEGQTIEVGEVVAYFAGMDVENRAVLLWLDAMLKTGLLLNYDPTVQDIDAALRVEVSPAGRQHLYWSTGNNEYLSAMAEVTRLLVEATFMELQNHRKSFEWRSRTAVFIDYLLQEDQMYCVIPEHDAYQSQGRIRRQLEAMAVRLREYVPRPPVRTAVR